METILIILYLTGLIGGYLIHNLWRIGRKNDKELKRLKQ